MPRGSVLTSGVTKDPYPNMCTLTFESESPSYLTTIWQYSPTFSAGRPCASNCDSWAAQMALGNTVDMFMVKAILAHVGPHQINIAPSAFSPPRSLDRSNQSGHATVCRRKKPCERGADLTRDIRFTVRTTFGYRISASSSETHTPILANCYISWPILVYLSTFPDCSVRSCLYMVDLIMITAPHDQTPSIPTTPPTLMTRLRPLEAAARVRS